MKNGYVPLVGAVIKSSSLYPEPPTGGAPTIKPWVHQYPGRGRGATKGSDEAHTVLLCDGFTQAILSYTYYSLSFYNSQNLFSINLFKSSG